MLYLGSDTDAFRDFSDYFHCWKDPRNIDGNPSGGGSVSAPVQALLDSAGGIRAGNPSFLYLPRRNSWVDKEIGANREIA